MIPMSRLTTNHSMMDFGLLLEKNFLVLLTLVFLFFSATAQAGVTKDKEALDSALQTGADKDTFVYQLENRADPFVPFITEKAASTNEDMDEIIDEDITLTGMQLFEPGQLTLVALMQIGKRSVAMVEDVTGKGYVLKEGTKIGRRGIVKQIAPNTVTIEETAETRAGKKIVTEVVMILKKEGDN